MAESLGIKYMERCLDLAVRAEGTTYPNPMVGAVIVYNDRIIGEGYHIRSGGPHAEVVAINSVRDKSLLRNSTLYVSLEPCSHFGKTPPCADLIIECGIPRVVIGTADTSPKVGGAGIARLRAAGLDVVTGLLEENCRRLNRRFFTFNEKKRPYITLKWAQSSDRFMDIRRTETSPAGPNWISGKTERVLVHKWRSEEQAILVGAETARIDNPSLNVRYWHGKDPAKIILSNSGKIGNYLTNIKTNGTVIVFTALAGDSSGNLIINQLEKEKPASLQVADYLYGEGIQSLLVEGGAMVISHFINSGMWDEARIFTGYREFRDGVRAPEIDGKLIEIKDFDTSRLEIVLNDPGIKVSN